MDFAGVFFDVDDILGCFDFFYRIPCIQCTCFRVKLARRVIFSPPTWALAEPPVSPTVALTNILLPLSSTIWISSLNVKLPLVSIALDWRELLWVILDCTDNISRFIGHGELFDEDGSLCGSIFEHRIHLDSKVNWAWITFRLTPIPEIVMSSTDFVWKRCTSPTDHLYCSVSVREVLMSSIWTA